MRLARVSLGLAGFVALIAATVALATLWLFLSDPATLADAVSTGRVTPLVRELANAFYEALVALLEWL
ncbi:MAG: hypothetical protein AB7I50_11995 [Vicinamibacterales bacterium]